MNNYNRVTTNIFDTEKVKELKRRGENIRENRITFPQPNRKKKREAPHEPILGKKNKNRKTNCCSYPVFETCDFHHTRVSSHSEGMMNTRKLKMSKLCDDRISIDFYILTHSLSSAGVSKCKLKIITDALFMNSFSFPWLYYTLHIAAKCKLC